MWIILTLNKGSAGFAQPLTSAKLAQPLLTGIIQLMKPKNLLLLLAGIAMLLAASPVATQAAEPAIPPVPYYDLPLCQPGYYPTDPGDCLPLGASQTIAQLHQSGFPYPIKELAAAKPDASLSDLPVRVARITGAETPVYASLDDAISGGTVLRTIPDGGSRYVTMIDSAVSGGRTFVRTMDGGWVEATPVYSWPKWQGFEFYATPQNDFGWTINPTPSYTQPSFAAPETGKQYDKYVEFQIYQIVEAEGYEWYEAGPGEWIPSLKSRRLVVDTTPPKGVDNNRWISIDLYNQTLAAYEDGRLVFAAVVGTGSGELYSDPGLYYIYEKRELEQMQGSYTSDRSDFYSLEGVPWAMYYNHAQAIHGIYWPASLGFTQSHGCVNMFPGDAHWLFNWAKLGDWVYVYDPSGQTPMPTPTPMGTPAQEIIYPTPTAQN